MKEVSAVAREFDRWFYERNDEWPPMLRVLGSNAVMSFAFLEQPAKNRTQRTNEIAKADLIAFASAYEAWIAMR